MCCGEGQPVAGAQRGVGAVGQGRAPCGGSPCCRKLQLALVSAGQTAPLPPHAARR